MRAVRARTRRVGQVPDKEIPVLKRFGRSIQMRVLAGAAGSALLLGGCDPTIQATVENGIITATNSLIASFFQAVLQLSQESDTTQG
jgi:hypothetical protein